MGKNLFVVIDGVDGSGKSSLILSLKEYLSSKNKYNILNTREPSNGKYGKEIRKILESGEDPLENKELLLDLFVKDREDHLNNEIKPFLEGGKDKIIICDRYYHSTIAFQEAQGIPMDDLIEKNIGFLSPDLTLILDLDPAVSLERIKDQKKEKFEQKEFLEKVRANFLKLKDVLDEEIEFIDASKGKEEVLAEVVKKIEAILD